MKRLAIIGAVLLLSAGTTVTSTARADFLDGNKLLALCTSEIPADKNACAAYLMGATDAFNYTMQLAVGIGIEQRTGTRPSMADINRCVPVGVTTIQVRDTVVHYLQQHPEKRHYGVSQVFVHAIMGAFCPSEEDAPTVSRIPEQPKPKWQPVPVKKPAKPLPLDTE